VIENFFNWSESRIIFWGKISYFHVVNYRFLKKLYWWFFSAQKRLSDFICHESFDFCIFRFQVHPLSKIFDVEIDEW